MDEKLLKNKMAYFDKRWDYDDKSNPEEVFAKFRTCVLEAFQDIDNDITDTSSNQFARSLGIKKQSFSGQFGYSVPSTIINTLSDTLNPVEFYRLLELLFSLDFKTSTKKENYFEELQGIRDLQPVEVDFKNSERWGILIVKSGERYLDENLVNKTLSFLEGKSHDHFEDALREYDEGKEKSYIKSCEQLRRTIEEFLREKLKNGKNLSNNIQELQTILKTKTDPQIRNILFSIISYLNNYFDANSKHQDGKITKSENEFLIYQVALLLRFTNSIFE